jgi:hypothetical protein
VAATDLVAVAAPVAGEDVMASPPYFKGRTRRPEDEQFDRRCPRCGCWFKAKDAAHSRICPGCSLHATDQEFADNYNSTKPDTRST